MVIRSVTTAGIAFGIILIMGYQVIHTGTVDTAVGAFVSVVVGFYMGAHVSQNGAAARSRSNALAVEAATGEPAPPDPYLPTKLKEQG